MTDNNDTINIDSLTNLMLRAYGEFLVDHGEHPSVAEAYLGEAEYSELMGKIATSFIYILPEDRRTGTKPLKLLGFDVFKVNTASHFRTVIIK